MQVKTLRDEIERAELNKLINKRRREEKRKNNLELVEDTIQKGKSLKTANRKLVLGKQQKISLRENNGEIIKCRERMVTRVQEFYEKIYSSSINVPVTNQITDTSEVPHILIDEVKHALNKTKRGKAPGEYILKSWRAV